jgi:hypothetical protein
MTYLYNSDVQHQLHLLQTFFDSLDVPGGNHVGKMSNATPPQHISTAGNIPSPMSLQYRYQLIAHHDPFDLSSKNIPQQYATPRPQPRLSQSSTTPQQQLAQTNSVSMKNPSDTVLHKSPRQSQPTHEISVDDDSPTAKIHYILAKQFKAIGTGECLGLPAFNESMIMLGFYVESDRKLGAGTFVPLEMHSGFGPKEISQAKIILEQAIEKNSQAVHNIKSFDSMESMLDHALVYMWTKEMQSEKERIIIQ